MSQTQEKDKGESRERAKERACDKAIKDTLAYRSIFKYPMSFYQIATFLNSNKEFDYDFFKRSLKRLCKNETLKIKDQKYYLANIKPVSWESRAKYTQEHLKRANPISALLAIIPWIKLVAITGSVAANNAEKKDDIDIFIVCTKNRMWLTRFFTVLLLKAVNMYRTEKEPEGKVCPNIFLDETNMEWREKKRNLYVAQEIIMMYPVINRDETYFRFIKKNSWVFNYFAHFKVGFPEKFKPNKYKQSKIVDKLDNIFMRLQQRYMKKKQTSEITTKNFIHFNKMDWSQKVLAQFDEKTRAN